MGDIELIPCSEMTLNKYKVTHNLELNWLMPINVFKVKCCRRYIGLIDFSHTGMFNEKSWEIHNFEVFKKGKGHGTKMLEALIKELPGQTLYLYAIDIPSKLFWEKSGFITKGDGTRTTSIHYYDVPELK